VKIFFDIIYVIDKQNMTNGLIAKEKSKISVIGVSTVDHQISADFYLK
jgi:hypothetical protein